MASGKRSRPRQCRSRPVLVVWSLRWMLATRGSSDVFRMKLRSFSDDRARLQLLGRRNGFSELTVGCRRWGALSAARPAKRRPPGDCWKVGKAVWMVGGAFW